MQVTAEPVVTGAAQHGEGRERSPWAVWGPGHNDIQHRRPVTASGNTGASAVGWLGLE